MQHLIGIHQAAMELAERACLARLKGDLQSAKSLSHKAFEEERKAAMFLKDQLDIEPTRSVLFRSAATLANDCGEVREAERLVAFALSGNPPEEIAEELRDLLEQVNLMRHLSSKGISLLPNEFQLSILGEAIGFGLARVKEFTKRVEDVEKLIYRVIERMLGKPFRDSPNIPGDILKDWLVFISVPRPSSFAVSFRIGSGQMRLPGMDEMDGETVVLDIIDGIELINSNEIEALKDKIPDENYCNNFIKLTRSIAPDGKRVSRVGFSSYSARGEKRVFLSTPRNIVRQLESSQEKVDPKDTFKIKGKLLKADSTKSKTGTIEILENGSKHIIIVPKGMMADIVRPMYELDVIATAKKKGKSIYLDEIDLMPDDG